MNRAAWILTKAKVITDTRGATNLIKRSNDELIII